MKAFESRELEGRIDSLTTFEISDEWLVIRFDASRFSQRMIVDKNA